MTHKLLKPGIAILAMFVLINLMVVPAFARQDKILFQFVIKGNHSNTFSKGRDRATTNPGTPWMVNFTKSTEDADPKIKCKTTFWLSKSIFEPLGDGYSQVSDKHTITEKSGKRTFGSYQSGCGVNVYLTAENNNDTAITYSATGYWDEEYTN